MGTKWANVTEASHSEDEEKVSMELPLDVPVSHFAHLGVKGNSVAGRPCQGGGTRNMFSVTNVQRSLFLEEQEGEQQCLPRVYYEAGDESGRSTRLYQPIPPQLHQARVKAVHSTEEKPGAQRVPHQAHVT